MKVNEKDEQVYQQEMESKAGSLSGIKQELSLLLIKSYAADYDEVSQCIEKIESLLQEDAVGDAHNYFNPLIHSVTAILGEYPGRVYQYIVNHKVEYPYSVGYYRRPFRTTMMNCHQRKIIELAVALIKLYKCDFSIEKYLTLADYPAQHNEMIAYVIAFEIDGRNEAVIQALKDIIYGDNNTALLTRSMIKGIFLSHHQETYTMLGELLIAAKLQEGLRQSIVETMDEGTLAATIYMLNIIIEHDFIRYSSVVRALDVWLGMGFEAMNSRVVKQCIQYAYTCLQDEKTCTEWLHSRDVNQLYMSLWATAVKEEQNVANKIHYVMENSQTYQKIVAQYFLTQSQNQEMKFAIAQQYLDQSEKEMQYHILSNYVYECSYSWGNKIEEDQIKIARVSMLEDKVERRRQFDLLKKMFLSMEKKEMSFPSQVFEWLQITYSSDLIITKMLYLIAYDMDHEWIAELIDLKDRMSPDSRGRLLRRFAKDYGNLIQREFVFAALSDKSMSNRELALAHIKVMELSLDEIHKIAGVLNLKTGVMRQEAIKIFLTLPPGQLEIAIDDLLQSKNELQRLGALEVITEINNSPANVAQCAVLKTKLSYIIEPTEKEKVLLAKLGGEEEYNPATIFGLREENNEILIKEPRSYDDFTISEVFTVTKSRVTGFLTGLYRLIEKYRVYEYEVQWSSGYKDTYLVGARLDRCINRQQQQEKNLTNIACLPLGEVWQQYLVETRKFTPLELLQMQFYFEFEKLYDVYFDELQKWEKKRYESFDDCWKTFVSELYDMEKIKEINNWTEGKLYYSQARTIIAAYFNDGDKKEIFPVVSKVVSRIIQSIPEQKGADEIFDLVVEPWLTWQEKTVYDDASFAEYFYLKYKLYKMGEFKKHNPSLENFIRAYELRIIDKNELLKELMLRPSSANHMYHLTRNKDEFIKKHPSMRAVRDQIIDRVLEIELKRGDLATAVTKLAMNIKYYEGMEYFVKILLGVDKETFVRGYISSYGDSITRKETFSHLLQVCYPRAGEEETLLRTLCADKKITEKRLLEAAMYAPQWIEIIANYLKWTGLRSAAWYFHAHTNENFSAEKETIVAHYSPISPAEFNDGAFDIQWFKEAYSQLGAERFAVLYDCAKYISAGANHRRSQLFADATLGNLKLDEIKESVIDKRNKDHLLCYALIPINQGSDKDVLERYEFIQQFLQESKTFGAQRRASEGTTVSIALNNLARNASYKDVIRLTWDMEAQKIKEVLHYLAPKVIDDITVQLVIHEDGSGDIQAVKNDKVLKTVPAKYNKHEYVLVLKDLKNDLKDQYRRAKAELERSMEAENTFTIHELRNLMENPVIAPLVKNLVFKVGSHFGYFSGGELVGVQGANYKIRSKDDIGIAHPIHLFESGMWSDFQQDIFDRQIKQPFKQVFREIYIPNEDELASGTVSRRYAGHQVQPKKTVALLKNRLWTVSYEEGLQKVYYKENIIATMYALADWFSPGDVECPTLETVQFYERHSYKSVEVKNIPPIIFSEIMRDVDLVVSVAHVGGVDPEASLSTIAMRKAIIKESLRLMRLENIRLEGNFAHIRGNLGEYSVHLGSGIVYKQGTGSLYIIPVHSQHKGRIFLPFMDEDPKTAEILSKIVMLAQDNKIKDPTILDQLKG